MKRETSPGERSDKNTFKKAHQQIKALSTAMVQPVETATDHRHTHKFLGLIVLNVYPQADNTQTNGRYQTYYLPGLAVDNDESFNCFK